MTIKKIHLSSEKLQSRQQKYLNIDKMLLMWYSEKYTSRVDCNFCYAKSKK